MRDIEVIRAAGPDGLMTAEQVGAIEGYCVSTIYEWGRGDRTPEGFPLSYRKGGKRFWLRQEVEAYYGAERVAEVMDEEAS